MDQWLLFASLLFEPNVHSTALVSALHWESGNISQMFTDLHIQRRLIYTRILRPWDFQGKSTGVGCHFLFQGIFPTQGLNPALSHCRQTLYPLSHQGSPISRGAWRASSIPGSDLDNKMLNYEPDAMMRWDFDDLGIGEGILHIEWIYVIWIWNKESQTLLIILPMNMWSLFPSYLNLSWSCDNLTNRLWWKWQCANHRYTL